MKSIFGQNSFEFISKVEDGKVYVKWIPKDYESLLTITKGAKITRVQSQQNASNIDFSSGKQWDISPLADRYDPNKLEDSIVGNFILLTESLFDKAIGDEQKNFAFGTCVIENVINPEFQYFLGNAFVDDNIEKKKVYAYKIEIGNEFSDIVFVDTKAETEYPVIETQLSLDKKRVVDVEWDYSTIQKLSLGFDIEHYSESNKTPNKLNNLTHLPFKSKDEKQDASELYRHDSAVQGEYNFYRVTGRDQFGMNSLTSEWKKIYVPQLINATVEIDTIKRKGKERIILANVAELQKNPHISKAQLYRSNSMLDGYELMEEQQYSDSTLSFSLFGKESGDHFYYKLCLVNKDDSVWSAPYYFFTLDQEPPQAPTLVVGKVDSVGVTKISWNAPSDEDLIGYKVYRANQMSEEFVEQTKEFKLETSFIDTLPLDNLTSEIYYFIRAVDENYNQSVSSDTLLLLKPDTIAPVAPVIVDVLLLDSIYQVKWINSNSEDLYLTKLVINSTDTVDLNTGQVDFIDNNLTPGKYFSYQLIAFDRSQNVSTSKVIQRYFEPGFRKELKVSGVANRAQKNIRIEWEKPKEEVYSYEIRRGKVDGSMRHFKTITDSSIHFIEDSKLEIGETYLYSIKYITKTGIHSIPARVEVNY